jgi:hypothetical protein
MNIQDLCDDAVDKTMGGILTISLAKRLALTLDQAPGRFMAINLDYLSEPDEFISLLAEQCGITDN